MFSPSGEIATEANILWLREQGYRYLVASRVRVTVIFQQPNGRAVHIRKATQPEGQHRALCFALAMDTQPGRTERLIY